MNSAAMCTWALVAIIVMGLGPAPTWAMDDGSDKPPKPAGNEGPDKPDDPADPAPSRKRFRIADATPEGSQTRTI